MKRAQATIKGTKTVGDIPPDFILDFCRPMAEKRFRIRWRSVANGTRAKIPASSGLPGLEFSPGTLSLLFYFLRWRQGARASV
jgi:hypothetical protein